MTAAFIHEKCKSTLQLQLSMTSAIVHGGEFSVLTIMCVRGEMARFVGRAMLGGRKANFNDLGQEIIV
jgi:hypothetical protein